MSNPFVVFVSDASLGLPVTLLLGAIALWLLWNADDRPRRVRRPVPREISDRDPVSRTFYAFESGRYSDVVERALGRLDEASMARFRTTVARLPMTPWGARRLGPQAPTEVRAFRRLRARLERMKAVSTRREAGIWIRLDFWRTRSELLRRFRGALGPVLEQIDGYRSAPLGGPA